MSIISDFCCSEIATEQSLAAEIKRNDEKIKIKMKLRD